LKVFVTGATGFLGGSVSARLVAAGHEVLGLTRDASKAGELRRRGVEPVTGGLRAARLLHDAASRADAVVNAADSDDLEAVRTLIRALAGSGKTLIHSSGASIAGAAGAGGVPTSAAVDETIMDRGSSWQPVPEKAGRVRVDRTVLAAAGQGIRTAVFCNVGMYGDGRGLKQDSFQIPAYLSQARKSGVVRYAGAGENIATFCHIDDVCELYCLALDRVPPGSFYFPENGHATMREVAQALADSLACGPAQPWDIDSAISEWGYELAVHGLASSVHVRGTRARRDLRWNPARPSVTDWIRTRYSPADLTPPVSGEPVHARKEAP
jgi:nucleoside-diphosphate-sugar epimerase